MSFLNELEGWITNWFEDPANNEDYPSLVDAATILVVIERLREVKEEEK